ncbi:acyltransferase family protein [Pseudarthrobacter oxydans]|uniref:acyltransferase family protein n=1 Tax=Pseudarthrobacter oxydans TaxID=1671 RepID=UPI003D2C7EDA
MGNHVAARKRGPQLQTGEPAPKGAHRLSSVPRTFRPDIEGLRAIAVLLVVLDHAGVPGLQGGYVGVDVFFVVSGFLITGLLLKGAERSGRISIVGFYARRARRILPAATLVLAVTVVSSFALIGGTRAARTAEDGLWAALFASNFREISQGTDYWASNLPQSPLQHYWSLAIEEQFYLFWPAAIIAVAAIGRRVPLRTRLAFLLTATIAVSLAWSVYATTENASAAYFSPLTRAWELAAGAILAVLTPAIMRLPVFLAAVTSVSGLIAIAAAALTLDEFTRYPGSAAILPVGGTVLVIIGGTIAPKRGAEVLLQWGPLQWLGKLSYSLYLWHWPVLILAAASIGTELAMTARIALVVVALALSVVTFKYVEFPARNSSWLKARRPSISVAFGAAVVALSLGLTGIVVSVLPKPSPTDNFDDFPVARGSDLPTADEVAKAVADGVNAAGWTPEPPVGRFLFNRHACVRGLDAPTGKETCRYGDANGAKTVVVYGDSHAEMWADPLGVTATELGRRFEIFTMFSCPPADFSVYNAKRKGDYPECKAFRADSLAKIEALNPSVVLISGQRQGTWLEKDGRPDKENTHAAWEQGLASTIKSLSAISDRVVVIGDIAYSEKDPHDCVTSNSDDVRRCHTPRSYAVDTEHNEMEKRVAEAGGAAYVDVVPWLCGQYVCPAVVSGFATHADAQHISTNYALWLRRSLAEAAALLP